MPTEIERKFLVTGTEWRQGDSVRLCQGYLSRAKERTVRVRLAGEKAFLTIKGISKGASRAEFEYEIPVSDAEQLMKLCDGPLIEKVRHVVAYKGLKWDVDEFFGENAGLVVAEVELEREDQPFEKPDWLGQEVTYDPRYFNSSLATNPYRTWS
jgi:adenylate cyclase